MSMNHRQMMITAVLEGLVLSSLPLAPLIGTGRTEAKQPPANSAELIAAAEAKRQRKNARRLK